jgi:hypothetical protein
VAMPSTAERAPTHPPSFSPHPPLPAGRPDESGRVVSQALMFAATAGTLVGSFIFVMGPALIAATGVNAAVAAPALGYLRVRALSTPLVVCIVALQVREARRTLGEAESSCWMRLRAR